MAMLHVVSVLHARRANYYYYYYYYYYYKRATLTRHMVPRNFKVTWQNKIKWCAQFWRDLCSFSNQRQCTSVWSALSSISAWILAAMETTRRKHKLANCSRLVPPQLEMHDHQSSSASIAESLHLTCIYLCIAVWKHDTTLPWNQHPPCTLSVHTDLCIRMLMICDHALILIYCTDWLSWHSILLTTLSVQQLIYGMLHEGLCF